MSALLCIPITLLLCYCSNEEFEVEESDIVVASAKSSGTFSSSQATVSSEASGSGCSNVFIEVIAISPQFLLFSQGALIFLLLLSVVSHKVLSPDGTLPIVGSNIQLGMMLCFAILVAYLPVVKQKPKRLSVN